MRGRREGGREGVREGEDVHILVLACKHSCSLLSIF